MGALKQNRIAQLTVLAGFIGGTYGVIDALATAFTASDQFALFSTLMLTPALFALLAALKFFDTQSASAVPITKFADATSERFQRPEAMAAVTAAIADPKQTILVAFGTSGSGKSYLFEKMLPEVLEPTMGIACLTFTPDGQLRTKFEAALRKRDVKFSSDARKEAYFRWPSENRKRICVVIDQAERLWQVSPHDKDKREKDLKFLGELIKATATYGSITIIISIRKEMLCEAVAQFLEQELGFKAIHIAGISAQTDDPAFEQIFGRIRSITTNPEIAMRLVALMKGTDGRILPIKAHLIGVAAELLKLKLEYYYGGAAPRSGDDDVLVTQFFCAFEAGCGDENAFRRVLLALSMLRLRGLGATPQALARMTHESLHTVQGMLEYMRGLGIVKNEGTTFEVVHDYLAEAYLDNIIDKIDIKNRNNISYFVEQFASMRLRDTRTDIESVAVRRTHRDWILSAMLSICLFRLLFPDAFADVLARVGITVTGALRGGVDLSYLPIMVTHLMWVYYILAVTEEFFLRVNVGAVHRGLSWLVAGAAVALALAGTIRSEYWVQQIAAGGAILALHCLAFQWRTPMSLLARSDFQEWGLITLVNMIIAFALGTAITMFAYDPAQMATSPSGLVLANAIVGGIIGYFWKILWDRHASSTACRYWLGLVDRAAPKPALAD
jgi:hypothetical protein